jgi:SAM-dependent methyltransferase
VTVTPTEPVDQLFRRVVEADGHGYDPWFYRYCGTLASTAEATRYRRHLSDLLEFGRVDPRGATVLDAGCGFGFALVTLRSLGAAQAFGIDVSGPMIRTIRAYLPLLPDEVSNGIHVAEASVAEMPYADRSFDLILSVEAISHYREVGAFIDEAARVLRSGGTLLISDHNNGRNPRIRRDTHALWEEFETGRPSKLGGRHERDGSYRLRREEIIRAAFPKLSDEVVADLVLRTAFMSRDQIIAAVRDYEDGGGLPSSFFDGSDAPVDPNSGAVHERLFDPYQLADLMRASGFAVRVRGHWGGAGGNPVIRLANGFLGRVSRVTIASAPSFVIAARLLRRRPAAIQDKLRPGGPLRFV